MILKPKTFPIDVATHGRQAPECIVIHDTEGGDARGIRDITGVAAYWRSQGQGLGAHFIIDAEGNIGQGADPAEVTWAVAGHNTGCIHIELIGFASFVPEVWFARRKQMLALKKLLAYLCVKYDIECVGPSRTGVIRHSDFHDVPAGLYHHDPGVGFPFSTTLRQVRAIIKRERRQVSHVSSLHRD